jgi:hypothetical protein
MLVDVTYVKYMRDYTVYLEFDDGSAGEVNLADCVGDGGVFMPLADKDYFKTVSVDSTLGTLRWPNGADIAPEFLYERVKH